MITESSVAIRRIPVRDFRFERFTSKEGVRMWQGACQFEVHVDLDPALTVKERSRIEYRQFIRGRAWYARGWEDWTPGPNANECFHIPAYEPGDDEVPEFPQTTVDHEGLDWEWKEDGQLKPGDAKPYRYGYRRTADQWGERMMDVWTYPDKMTGYAYRLRDTPSLYGPWGNRPTDNDAVWLWIELYFQGFVVEVERVGPDAYPIRVLKRKSWEYSWK